jgi:hypothetical protein
MANAAAGDDQPLGLTVYSMPVPGEVAADAQARTRLGRWKMLAVLLVCAAPVVASYFTYYVVRPDARRNVGALIDPQRPLPDVMGTSLDGQAVNLRSLKGQWLVVSLSSGHCDASCANRLYLQRQLRESLGKDKDRLDWVWFVTDGQPVADTLQLSLKGATVVRVGERDLAQWLLPQSGHALDEHLYLVDPMGNWMMRFAPQLDTKGAVGVKRDLERLMRASAFWDTPGR